MHIPGVSALPILLLLLLVVVVVVAAVVCPNLFICSIRFYVQDLSIQYDGTVRDAGKNVIQFRYGDDGVDVCQSSFIQQAGLNLFADNAALFNHRWRSSLLTEDQSRVDVVEQCPLPRPLQMLADQVGLQRQMVR